MKYCIKLALTLLALGLPLSAQAWCDRYPNSTLSLNTPATISVPDSLPIGGIILDQALNGSAPAFIAECYRVTNRHLTGRYPDNRYPGSRVYRTEVPGVGLRIVMTWADGRTAAYFAIHSGPPQYTYAGKYPSFTSARAILYKMGPITTGTIPSGNFWSYKFSTSPDTFRLNFGNSIRFVRAAATCDLATGDVNRTIPLPTIQTSALKDVVYAGEHNFDLTANCTNTANVTFRFTGTPAPGNNLLFANTGTAGGVALWLYSRSNGQTINNGATRTVAVSGNRAVLQLGAAYHKNGTVSQGTLVSTATVNITYN